MDHRMITVIRTGSPLMALVLLGLALLSSSLSSRAETADFDDIFLPVPPRPFYQLPQIIDSGGLRFAQLTQFVGGPTFYLVSEGSSYYTTSNRAYIDVRSVSALPEKLFITASDGSAINLTSVIIEEVGNPSTPPEVRFNGYRNGSLIVTRDVALDGTPGAQPVSFLGMDGLTHIGVEVSGDILIDDLVYSSAPEIQRFPPNTHIHAVYRDFRMVDLEWYNLMPGLDYTIEYSFDLATWHIGPEFTAARPHMIRGLSFYTGPHAGPQPKLWVRLTWPLDPGD